MRTKKPKNGFVDVEIMLTTSELATVDADSKKNDVSIGCWLSDAVTTFFGGKARSSGYKYRGGKRSCLQKVFKLDSDLDVKLGKMASKGGTTKSELIRCAIRGSLKK
jgi:hypothetical protein